MVDSKLVCFIRNTLKRGVPLQTIKTQLKERGWSEKEINSAYELASVKTFQRKPKEISPDLSNIPEYKPRHKRGVLSSEQFKKLDQVCPKCKHQLIKAGEYTRCPNCDFFCQKCGEILPMIVKTCPKCGAKIKVWSAKFTDLKNKTLGAFTGVVIISIILSFFAKGCEKEMGKAVEAGDSLSVFVGGSFGLMVGLTGLLIVFCLSVAFTYFFTALYIIQKRKGFQTKKQKWSYNIILIAIYASWLMIVSYIYAIVSG